MAGNYHGDMKKILHRVLRSLGIHIERHRDPYDDLSRLVRNVRVAVDGGAYHGGASREFLRRFSGAAVHAFEANPDLAERLAGSLHDPRFTLHRKALSDAPGSLKFFLPREDFTGSLLKPDASFGESREIEVEATTLDSLGIQPDVIKLDLQGAELKALGGATLALPHVQAILCEVNFVPRYEGCALFHEVAAFLDGHGLRLFRLYEVHADKKGQWQFADAIFLRR